MCMILVIRLGAQKNVSVDGYSETSLRISPDYKNEWYFICRKDICQQRGAVEACWAHNSEVGRSKLLAASFPFLLNLFTIS